MPTFVDETVVPDSPADIIPEVSDVEYPCEVCGKEAGPYGGRGRKPKRCEDHKKNRSVPTASAPRVGGANLKLAEQATEVLCSIDGLLILGATIVGFSDTAKTIADADEVFRTRVLSALVNSPDTARKIIRYGSKAGDSALFFAIGLHIATIAPVFLSEAKEKKAIRDAKRAEEAEQN